MGWIICNLMIDGIKNDNESETRRWKRTHTYRNVTWHLQIFYIHGYKKCDPWKENEKRIERKRRNEYIEKKCWNIILDCRRVNKLWYCFIHFISFHIFSYPWIQWYFMGTQSAFHYLVSDMDIYVYQSNDL